MALYRCQITSVAVCIVLLADDVAQSIFVYSQLKCHTSFSVQMYRVKSED